MECGPSGTDDDLPPSHHNRSRRGGRVPGNGRPIIDAASYLRVEDIETQIRRLEREAYSSVLRAFKAQSETITWEQEGLITDLRNELGVTDQEHREFLSRVNSEDIIRRIREWRRTGGIRTGVVNVSQPTHDTIARPTVSASRKRQRNSQHIPSLPFGAPSPTMRPQHTASMKPSLSAAREGAPPGSREKKLRSIYPEDIRWEGEEPGIDHRSDQGAPPRGVKKSTGRGGVTKGARRGRGSFTNQFKKNFFPTRKGIGKDVGDIEILHTDALLKEVNRVCDASHPDPLEIDKAKKVLKEHEQSLIDAISRLADASDGESGEDDERQFSRVPSIYLDQ
ncbi:protein EMSY-LIKE 3-like isoform X1 [Typha latifolia]|uniref:protein EMSY-LIKE 3-like isoform X1 n=1 Tax=Typha latifolia TaxID=4733 RepID=UPI003C2D060A